MAFLKLETGNHSVTIEYDNTLDGLLSADIATAQKVLAENVFREEADQRWNQRIAVLEQEFSKAKQMENYNET